MFAKEVRAVDFNLSSYAVPASAWYDGPAAGVVLRNKNGTRATVLCADDEETVADPAPLGGGPDDLAKQYVTDRRVERVVAGLDDRGEQPTFEAVYERVFETIIREEHRRLPLDDRSFDRRAFRSAIAAQVGRRLDG